MRQELVLELLIKGLPLDESKRALPCERQERSDVGVRLLHLREGVLGLTDRQIEELLEE